MAVKFFFKKERSSVLGVIHRPVAKVQFWSKKGKYWLDIWMIVDTGADYTLLPRFLANDLQIDLEKDCKIFSTTGIGGQERVYFLSCIKVRIGKWEGKVPIGFLDRDEVPPLLGRHKFIEKFDTLFSKKHFVQFDI